METVYRGSIEIIEDPKDNTGRANLDFGWGFYVTKYKKQAELWAKRKYDLAKNRNIKSKPIINFYHLNRDKFNQFKYKYFIPDKKDDDNKEWIKFCIESRLLIEHDYDIVEGPMLDGYVEKILEAYLDGSMGFDELILKSSLKKDTHQIMVRRDALSCLDFYKCEEVDYE